MSEEKRCEKCAHYSACALFNKSAQFSILHGAECAEFVDKNSCFRIPYSYNEDVYVLTSASGKSGIKRCRLVYSEYGRIGNQDHLVFHFANQDAIATYAFTKAEAEKCVFETYKEAESALRVKKFLNEESDNNETETSV